MLLLKTFEHYPFIKAAKAKKLNAGLLAMVVGLLSGLIALINVYDAFAYHLLKAVQLILFFVVGSLCIATKNKYFSFYPAEKRNLILIVAGLLCTLLSLLYISFKKEVWLMAFSSTAVFTLPFILQYCWALFNSIPDKKFTAWYPQQTSPGRSAVSLDSVLLRLKLTQHANDVDEKTYTVFVQHYIKLGDFFSRFLVKYNAHAASAIEDDMNGSKYAWVFFESVFFGLTKRRLDPYLTINENRLRKHSVVYVKRLMKRDTSSL